MATEPMNEMTSQPPHAAHPLPGLNEDAHRRGGRPGRLVRGALGQLPTLLVLATLGGLAAWGHANGWKAPKFSDLTAEARERLSNITGSAKRDAAAAVAEDWCELHNVPDSRCIACRPELVGASAADWCKEHGTKESTCTTCHPEILTTGVAGDWCPEHGVPETSCTLCHPEIAVKGQPPAPDSGVTVTTTVALNTPTRGASTPAAAPHDAHGHDEGEQGYADGEDAHTSGGGSRDAEEGHVHRGDPKTCQTHTLRVQFASPGSVQKAGVKLAAVAERPMSASIRAVAEADYDRTRLARLSGRAAGTAWRVEKEVGQPVKKGEVLALVDAAEVGKAKAELLSAVAALDLRAKTFRRLRTSAEQGFKTQAELQEADAAVREAEIRLFNARQALINLGLPAGEQDLKTVDRRAVQFLGLPQSIVGGLDPASTTGNLLPIVAPFDGVVIIRNVVAGEAVEPAEPLFEIADTRRMWVTADLRPAEAARVKLGQTVTFRPDEQPDLIVRGKITWISTAVDDQTRTVRVRADVENPGGRLKAHAFGAADITIRQAAQAVAVPDEAIQWEGCCHITFVRLRDDVFQVRKVKPGAKADGFTEVDIGLLPGEVVAAAGSHVLKSEILKSALGAGCAHEH